MVEGASLKRRARPLHPSLYGRLAPPSATGPKAITQRGTILRLSRTACVGVDGSTRPAAAALRAVDGRRGRLKPKLHRTWDLPPGAGS